MRICFSRDRAAQLDLLWRSLERHAPPERTVTIWHASTPVFRDGYKALAVAPFTEEDGPQMFDRQLRSALENCHDKMVTFFCDDDIMFRPFHNHPSVALAGDDDLLTVSFRLGRQNTQMPLPEGFPVWEWHPLPRHDFGFPASIDGHTFRISDVLAMIGDEMIPNPTMLETVLNLKAERLGRPLMACFPDQCLVGVPVNRVSPSSGVPHGLKWPQTAEGMNERFLAGERIDLDAIDFSQVDSCHHEFLFQWRYA